MAAASETRQFAGEQAGRLLRHLAFQINHSIKSCSPEAVHDVRVAIRRFNQAIAVFKPMFSGKETRKIRRRLKKVMEAAGEVRNSDIALKFLAKSHLADAAVLKSKLRSRRKEGSRVLISELKRWRDRQMSLKWRTALEAALARNHETSGGAAIQATARQLLRRMVKDFYRNGNAAAAPKASAEDLHRFRIAAKKFRYTLELFAPLYGPSLERRLARMKAAQTLLGEINDCVTVSSLVAELGGSDRLLARLKRRQRKKTEEFRQYWGAEFQDEAHMTTWLNPLRPPLGASAMRKPMARATSASSLPHRKRAAASPSKQNARAASAAS